MMAVIDTATLIANYTRTHTHILSLYPCVCVCVCVLSVSSNRRDVDELPCMMKKAKCRTISVTKNESNNVVLM